MLLRGPAMSPRGVPLAKARQLALPGSSGLRKTSLLLAKLQGVTSNLGKIAESYIARHPLGFRGRAACACD